MPANVPELPGCITHGLVRRGGSGAEKQGDLQGSGGEMLSACTSLSPTAAAEIRSGAVGVHTAPKASATPISQVLKFQY